MFIVHVFIHVKQDNIQAFKETSKENAQNSIREPGIARFDVIQQIDDPSRFMLVEVYRTEEDTSLHKETQHYKKWRDSVEEMMAEPRYSIKYANIFPGNENW
jgi:(4S)-4-hydroxy-5-phosphonooxypentane-2,3-dione isomerase